MGRSILLRPLTCEKFCSDSRATPSTVKMDGPGTAVLKFPKTQRMLLQPGSLYWPFRKSSCYCPLNSWKGCLEAALGLQKAWVSRWVAVLCAGRGRRGGTVAGWVRRERDWWWMCVYIRQLGGKAEPLYSISPSQGINRQLRILLYVMAKCWTGKHTISLCPFRARAISSQESWGWGGEGVVCC